MVPARILNKVIGYFNYYIVQNEFANEIFKFKKQRSVEIKRDLKAIKEKFSHPSENLQTSIDGKEMSHLNSMKIKKEQNQV